jgi:N-carbamoyl-L-amino-acid hydrolase
MELRTRPVPAIDGARVWRELEELAQCSDAPAPAVTRVVFSAVDRRAREYVKSLCRAASLDIVEDAVGNTFARWTGTDATRPGVAAGSHIDAIPNAGRFDGTVGVIGAIEAVRALQRSGFRPSASIDVVMFTAEEPTRFGVGCLGSRILSSSLDPYAADALKDAQGRTLAETRAAAGFGGPLASAVLRPGAYAAFVELHIEQGPILEQRGADIGVVTAIAAPASLRVHIVGEGGHAGAVLMPDRRDSLVAASEIVLAVEAAARTSGSVDTVATVGVCDVFPGAINSVPSRTTLGVDVRDIDGATRDRALTSIERACEEIAARRQVSVTIEPLNADPPCRCAPEIVEAIGAAATSRGLSMLPLISRAYHDALFMSRLAPTGMIFIPCRGGVSHRPDEYATQEAIERGIAVLADTLAMLAA